MNPHSTFMAINLAYILAACLALVAGSRVGLWARTQTIAQHVATRFVVQALMALSLMGTVALFLTNGPDIVKFPLGLLGAFLVSYAWDAHVRKESTVVGA